MVAFVAEFSLVIGEQTGTADQDEVVILGEVLEEEPEPTEVGKVHQMRVVEDRGQRLPGVVEGEGPFAELAFAGEGGAFEFDAEGIAEDLDGVGVGVQGSRDGDDQVLVLGESLDDRFISSPPVAWTRIQTSA